MKIETKPHTPVRPKLSTFFSLAGRPFPQVQHNKSRNNLADAVLRMIASVSNLLGVILVLFEKHSEKRSRKVSLSPKSAISTEKI